MAAPAETFLSSVLAVGLSLQILIPKSRKLPSILDGEQWLYGFTCLSNRLQGVSVIILYCDQFRLPCPNELPLGRRDSLRLARCKTLLP